jgi:PAS domain S-box-containing protein
MTESPMPSSPPATGCPRGSNSLLLNERQFAAIVAHTPLVVIQWDRDGRITGWNAKAQSVFGWGADEVLGAELGSGQLALDPALEAARVPQLRAAATPEVRTIVTSSGRTKFGTVIWTEWNISVLYDEAGRMLAGLALGLDVTAQRATAEALSLSEARVRAALDGARMLAWDLDLVANKLVTSHDIPDFFGIPRGPDYSNPALSLSAVHPEDVASVLAGRLRAMESGEPMRYEFRGPTPAADGHPRWFSTRGQVIRDSAGRPIRLVAITTDVTELKRSEEEREALNRQRQDSQRWESLGVLAGGVAHDFNNILTVVLGSAGLARRGLPPEAAALAYLDQIEHSCRQAADVCRQMLAYAGRTQGPGVRTNLTALVREAVTLLEIPTARAGIQLELDDRVPPIQADPTQVRQVLLSLLTNAAEAMVDRSGTIAVRGTSVEVQHGGCESDFRLAPAAGQYVLLTVSDDGSGMTPEVRARMFDPFYSTKFAGRGLGLAAVLGIVRAHRGGIRVSTAPDQGTTVSVYWPVAPLLPHAAPPRPRPLPRTMSALVIDDEVFVREVTASTLEEIGFTPILAGDGASGLELFHRHRAAIKVAVIDVIMPGMTGDQVLEGIRTVDSNLPVVMVSGFSDRRILRAGLGPRTEFLQKPFHPEDLMALVRRLM